MRIQISIFIILGIGLLSLGTVVKKKDPIKLTQTEPIGYQDKLKEEVEGKKGPPVPTLALFPRERFLLEGPVEKRKEEKPLDGELDLDLLWEEDEELGEEGEELEEDSWSVWEDEQVKLRGERDDTWVNFR